MSASQENKTGLVAFFADPLAPGRRRRREEFATTFLSPGDVKPPDLPAAKVKRVVFYNHFHNGDVHLTRGIVRELIRLLPGRNFVYGHGCPPDLLADSPMIRHDASIHNTLRRNRPYLVEPDSGTVYINTWIGCLGTRTVQLYGGCNILLLRNILAASVRHSMGLELPPVEQCVPEPDYSRYAIEYTDQFMRHDARPKVLISNGKVLSMQSADFDFSPFIKALAEQFPDVLFIPSNPTAAKAGNIVQSADIIRKNGPDLNENGYLSTFCAAIIGRSSGTYSFSIHRRNLESGKLFLSFCHCPLEASLGFDDPVFSARCAFIASNDFRPPLMLRRMVRVVQLALENRSHREATVESMTG